MLSIKIKVQEIAYHRNGVCGNGFYAVIFRFKDGGKWRRMIASVFYESGNCAVFDIDETANGNISFAHGNSWRGDHFEDQLRTSIKEYKDKRYNEIMEVSNAK